MITRTLKPELIYVIGSLDRGGAETHLSLLAPALLRMGWKVTIYCLSHHGELAGQLAATGVRILGPTSAKYYETPRGLRFLLLATSAFRLWLYLLQNRNVIVHFFLPASYCLGAPVALLAGVKPLLMSRRSRNHYLDNKFFFRWLERKLHSRMTLLLGNSRRVVADLISEGAPPDRIQLIYNGVEVRPLKHLSDKSSAARTTMQLGDCFIIICVANLIPYKGHRDLIEALARCDASLKPKWKLLLVGRDDGIGSSLKKLAERYGILDQILFLGPRSDIAELLSASDLFVLPSHEEGFSNAILEAMSAALPVVATDVGGNAEAVVNGETGLIVPAKDPDALSAAIAKCIRSRHLCHTLGKAGAERVRELFSIKGCVERYDALYRSLLKEQMIFQGKSSR